MTAIAHEPQFFGCPLCGRYFRGAMARRQHLLNSTKCDVIGEVLRLQILLADREEALVVARRQRDEARSLGV